MDNHSNGDNLEELKNLIEAGRKAQINEYWAVATLSLLLSEIAVTKKLQHLGEIVEKTFNERWKRLVNAMRIKEQKTVTHILIPDIYTQKRGKFVHAGHIYKPTRGEMEWIVKYVIGFLNELY